MSRKPDLEALLLRIARRSVKETFSNRKEVLEKSLTPVSKRSINEEEEKQAKKQDDFEMPAEIKFGMVRDLIDNIRAGRSMKDADIKMNLVNYYDKLDEPERIAMYKYLYAISDILTAGVAWQNAPDPSDNPGAVKTVDKDPSVKAPDPNKKEDSRDNEKTSENIPEPDYLDKKPSKKSSKKQEKEKPVNKKKKKKTSSEIQPPIVVQGETVNRLTKSDILKVITENLRED